MSVRRDRLRVVRACERFRSLNWTDLYGCHGTSGSGVLQRNDDGELELLGPVRTGSDAWQSHLLCDPANFREGSRT